MSYNSDYEVRLATLGAMGGDVTKNYNSVYEIDLEILKLTEQGGGNASAIESVDELPDASENNNKLYRLSSDDNIYVSELKSRTETSTNRLPDEQQIDKAYIWGGEALYYKGAYKIICSDGELNWFGWAADGEIINFATALNAEECTPETPIIMIDGESEMWSNITTTSATTTMTMQEVEEDDVVEANGSVVPAIYNAPEANQIGNAYLWDGEKIIYRGMYHVNCLDGNIVAYGWGGSGNELPVYFTSKPASDLYFLASDNDEGLIARDFFIYWLDDSKVFEWEDNTITYNKTVENFTEDVGYEIYNIYIPQLNAPDSEQVGNAYIVTLDYNGDDKTYKYTGEQVTIIGTNGTFTGYKWKTGTSDDDESLVISNTTANNIYCELSDDTQEIWLLLLYDSFDSNTSTWSEGTIYTSNSKSVLFSTTSNFEENVDNPELSIVKYQRTETIEEWDWVKVATEEYVNEEIDTLSEHKANKVDFSIELNPMTGDANWTVLNTVGTGIYRVQLVVSVGGQSIVTQEGLMTSVLSGLKRTQTIMLTPLEPKSSGSPMKLHYRVTNTPGTTWYDYDYDLGVINDSTSGTDKTYSSNKIDTLISALDTRLTALGG